MASAKQIKARKLFAKRAKRGDFKKAIAKTKKVNSTKAHRSIGDIAKWHPEAHATVLTSSMPNPKAFSKKYLVIWIKRNSKNTLDAWLVPKKEFADYDKALEYNKKLGEKRDGVNLDVEGDPYWHGKPITQEAITEFLHGTK